MSLVIRVTSVERCQFSLSVDFHPCRTHTGVVFALNAFGVRFFFFFFFMQQGLEVFFLRRSCFEAFYNQEVLQTSALLQKCCISSMAQWIEASY